MGVGPIPWTAIREYAAALGLDDDDAEDFETMISALDRAYLEHVAKQSKAREKPIEKRPQRR